MFNLQAAKKIVQMWVRTHTNSHKNTQMFTVVLYKATQSKNIWSTIPVVNNNQNYSYLDTQKLPQILSNAHKHTHRLTHVLSHWQPLCNRAQWHRVKNNLRMKTMVRDHPASAHVTLPWITSPCLSFLIRIQRTCCTIICMLTNTLTSNHRQAGSQQRWA